MAVSNKLNVLYHRDAKDMMSRNSWQSPSLDEKGIHLRMRSVTSKRYEEQ
jgi:hypothetical protein